MSGSEGSYYDHESGSHFSDSYDYASASHWNFDLSGDNFTGYHYGASHHFSGTVRDGAVQIYDYGTGSWHTYQV